jgi:hypothetical protein
MKSPQCPTKTHASAVQLPHRLRSNAIHNHASKQEPEREKDTACTGGALCSIVPRVGSIYQDAALIRPSCVLAAATKKHMAQAVFGLYSKKPIGGYAATPTCVSVSLWMHACIPHPSTSYRRSGGIEPLGLPAPTDLKSAPSDQLGSVRHQQRRYQAGGCQAGRCSPQACKATCGIISSTKA